MVHANKNALTVLLWAITAKFVFPAPTSVSLATTKINACRVTSEMITGF